MKNSKSKPDKLIRGVMYHRYSTFAQPIHSNLSSTVRAAIYIRGSRQVAAQLQQVRLHAASDGAEVVKIYSDIGHATPIYRLQPAITQMLQDARNHEFDVLYVDTVFHLTRRIDSLIDIIETLLSLDINLKSLKPAFNLKSSDFANNYRILRAVLKGVSVNADKKTNL